MCRDVLKKLHSLEGCLGGVTVYYRDNEIRHILFLPPRLATVFFFFFSFTEEPTPRTLHAVGDDTTLLL